MPSTGPETADEAVVHPSQGGGGIHRWSRRPRAPAGSPAAVRIRRPKQSLWSRMNEPTGLASPASGLSAGPRWASKRYDDERRGEDADPTTTTDSCVDHKEDHRSSYSDLHTSQPVACPGATKENESHESSSRTLTLFYSSHGACPRETVNVGLGSRPQVSIWSTTPVSWQVW